MPYKSKAATATKKLNKSIERAILADKKKKKKERAKERERLAKIKETRIKSMKKNHEIQLKTLGKAMRMCASAHHAMTKMWDLEMRRSLFGDVRRRRRGPRRARAAEPTPLAITNQ